MKRHYVSLDGLRGTAAMSVAVLHITAYVSGKATLTHAFLAVNFFFILSGFVIAHAYEQRLVSDMSLLDFAKRRAVRLWPMIVAGLLLGAVYLVLRNHLQPGHGVTGWYILASLLFGLVLLPVSMVMGSYSYPLDLPCWSLLFETIANVFYALLCRYRLISGLALLVLIGCAILARSVDSSLELWDQPHNFTNRYFLELFFLNGFARVGLGFFTGVALYRYRDHRFLRRIPPLHSAAASLLLVILFLAPPFSTNTYDQLVTLLALPLILAASARHEARGLEASVCRFGGWLSYPFYLVHYPAMFIAVGAIKYLDKSGRLPLFLVETLTLMAGVIAAYLLGKFYDEPARAWLASRLHSKASGPHLDQPRSGVMHGPQSQIQQ